MKTIFSNVKFHQTHFHTGRQSQALTRPPFRTVWSTLRIPHVLCDASIGRIATGTGCPITPVPLEGARRRWFFFSLQVQRSDCRPCAWGLARFFQPAIRCYSSNFADVSALGDASHVERWPACDVLTAGFPCQPFSCANKTAIRSTHVNLDFCDIILRAARESGARMVILENVPSFRTVGRAQHDRLIAGLKSLSLHTTEAVLDATHFGVPQTRKRLFMVATIRQPPHIEEITALETSVASVLEDAICR